MRENEFSMVYQPIIDLKSNEVVGAESLIRWENNNFGTINPDEFISFSENTKQIHEIGIWVMNEVLRQFSEWNSMGLKDIFISFNVSSIQFERKTFIPLFIKNIEKYKLNPEKVVVEITETAFSQFLTAATLLEVKDHGMLVAIDDFGSGFSSMQRLLELPVDFMKIDGANIQKILTSSKYRAIVKNIISIGKSLNVKTIAECVETEEQAEFLLENDCDYVQGYLYHKPLKPNDAIKLLKH